jgi:hypothetical protein
MSNKRIVENCVLNIQLSANTEKFQKPLQLYTNYVIITVGLVVRLSNDYHELLICFKRTY